MGCSCNRGGFGVLNKEGEYGIDNMHIRTQRDVGEGRKIIAQEQTLESGAFHIDTVSMDGVWGIL